MGSNDQVMKHFIIYIASLTVSLFASLAVVASEVSYFDLNEPTSQLLLPIFELESSEDMYVRVEYSGSQPSIAIITPIGMPCTYNQAKPTFEENTIVYEISSAMEGQWYVHMLAEDSERLDISYGKLSTLNKSETPIYLWIVLSLVVIIIILSLCYIIPRVIEAKKTNGDSES